MILGQTATVKPVNGITIRKPNGQILSADGEIVIVDSYWLRRLNDGDVEEVIAAESAPSTKTRG